MTERKRLYFWRGSSSYTEINIDVCSRSDLAQEYGILRKSSLVSASMSKVYHETAFMGSRSVAEVPVAVLLSKVNSIPRRSMYLSLSHKSMPNLSF